MTQEMPETGRIYQGNCVEIMRGWPDKCVDAIITDPPYGIGFKYNIYQDTQESWQALMRDFIPEAKRICRGIIVFPSGCHKNSLFLWQDFAPRWIICWFKGSPGHAAPIGFNDWEQLFVYGDDIYRNAHDHFYAKPSDNESIAHPCPKSLDYYRWQIAKLTRPTDIILEPFAGSGGGLLVAEQAGRRWVGIELDPEYIKVAQARLDAENRQGKLF